MAFFDERKKWSGIAVTNKGVFVKANLKKTSRLTYYSWELFNPGWFTNASSTDLKFLSKGCRDPFMIQCKKCNEIDKKRTQSSEVNNLVFKNNIDSALGSTAVISSAFGSTTIKTNAVNASVNGGSGHGIMAEEANNVIDILLFKNAKIVGRDNAKNGADRLVNGQYIQSKYYKTPGKTIGSAFDSSNNGMYKYITKDGKPMQLEVPRDQYPRAVKDMETKIKQGKVPGVSDPKEATSIVKKGHYTYEQAVNLTKPGTIESLTYDMATGAVAAACAFGISFVITAVITWNRTHNINDTLEESLKSAAQVFGLSLVSHVLSNQLARTALFNTICKSAIGGNVFTGGVSFVVFALPDTIRVINRRITKTQYYLNMSTLFNGIAGATALGIAGGAIGTVASGGNPVGTAVGGTVGAVVGGTIASVSTAIINSIFIDDDNITYFRLINAYVMSMANEYLFTEKEVDELFAWLSKVPTKEWSKLIKNIVSSKNQENTVREYLLPHFEYVNNHRESFCIGENVSPKLV